MNYFRGMKFIEHDLPGGKVIEISSDEVIITSEQDALDIMANIGYLFASNKGHQVNFISAISEVL